METTTLAQDALLQEHMWNVVESYVEEQNTDESRNILAWVKQLHTQSGHMRAYLLAGMVMVEFMGGKLEHLEQRIEETEAAAAHE